MHIYWLSASFCTKWIIGGTIWINQHYVNIQCKINFMQLFSSPKNCTMGGPGQAGCMNHTDSTFPCNFASFETPIIPWAGWIMEWNKFWSKVPVWVQKKKKIISTPICLAFHCCNFIPIQSNKPCSIAVGLHSKVPLNTMTLIEVHIDSIVERF